MDKRENDAGITLYYVHYCDCEFYFQSICCTALTASTELARGATPKKYFQGTHQYELCLKQLISGWTSGWRWIRCSDTAPPLCQTLQHPGWPRCPPSLRALLSLLATLPSGFISWLRSAASALRRDVVMSGSDQKMTRRLKRRFDEIHHVTPVGGACFFMLSYESIVLYTTLGGTGRERPGANRPAPGKGAPGKDKSEKCAGAYCLGMHLKGACPSHPKSARLPAGGGAGQV